jgi:hypothetical protein
VQLRVLAVAESDSYLKWAVSLVAQLPDRSGTELVVASSPIRPSPAQRVAALAGTASAGHVPPVLSPVQLRRRVERERPDAVLLACTGPSAHAYQEALSRGSHRPVLISGIPGIALPARRRAWDYRGAIDLFVVHSHREVEEYDRVRALTGRTGRVALATLPFLATAAPGATTSAPAATAGPAADLVTAPDGGKGAPEAKIGLGGGESGRDRVLFATQAKVPVGREERIAILLALAELAAARPDLRVVVKTRGLSGEFHTHHEPHHYADLWRGLVAEGRVGSADTLEFAAGSMAEHLRRAVALVTVSSTAVLEAMALDRPVLLIDEFGVGDELINPVFVGSGCLGGLDALRTADFRHPQKRWLMENYFHPASDDTWIADLDELVTIARAGGLPPIAAGLDPARSPRRRRRDRLRLTPAGSALVRARHRVKKWLRVGPRRLVRRLPVAESS